MDMTITFPGNKKVDANIKNFTIQTDQPTEEGGANTAPEPFHYFLASIGTCIGYYILCFCQQRTIKTHNLALYLSTERNLKTQMIQTITITITVPKNFPKHYEKALIKTAELCTVKKHLDHPPQIQMIVQPKK